MYYVAINIGKFCLSVNFYHTANKYFALGKQELFDAPGEQMRNIGTFSLRTSLPAVETSVKISGLPFIKSIEEFDFTFQPKLDRQRVMSLFDLTFIRQKGNVIFLRPPGVGKTHLAVALALKACQAGMSIFFTTMEDLIGKLKKDYGAERKGRGRGYNKSALVIVDEVGYTLIDREEKPGPEIELLSRLKLTSLGKFPAASSGVVHAKICWTVTPKPRKRK